MCCSFNGFLETRGNGNMLHDSRRAHTAQAHEIWQHAACNTAAFTNKENDVIPVISRLNSQPFKHIIIM